MGYRHYLYVIDKDKLEKIKATSKPREENDFSLNYDKLCLIEENASFGYELGKLYFKDTDDITAVIYKDAEKIIDDCDVEVFIANQKSFFELANIYLKKAQRYYNSVYVFSRPKLFKVSRKDEDYMTQKEAIGEMMRDFASKSYGLRLVEFKEYEGDISIGWSYEYNAFNLIYLHRKIDFEKQVVVCVAH